jgi:uncharacterized protein (DUF885 family)
MTVSVNTMFYSPSLVLAPCLFSVFVCTGCAHWNSDLKGTRSSVDALLDEMYVLTMESSPLWASMIGERQYDAKLSDLSPEAVQKRLEQRQTLLERALKLEGHLLSATERVNLSLLLSELRQDLKAATFHPEQIPITQMGGPHTSLPQLPDRISFSTPQHYLDYAKRLALIPVHLDQHVDNMRAGLQSKNTPPKRVMQGVLDQIKAQYRDEFIQDPRRHPFFKPFKEDSVDAALADVAANTIKDAVLPSFEALARFVEIDYIPNCRASIAASESNGGLEHYQFLLDKYSTLSLSPDEIHATGVQEVKRIRSEMMTTIERSDFPNDQGLKGAELFAAFIAFLREDARFYYTSAETMLRDYAYIAKEMDALLPKLFGKLPRLPYGVREMPSFIAESAPTAYYYPGSPKNAVAGTFIVNTSQLSQRPRYEMRALTYHESVPGHHLQIALSQELAESGLHPWRELVSHTAFVEGWALYAEKLGLELGGTQPPSPFGLYRNAYDDFGRLSYEMWRALRLVVDTGLHALGWSRQEAVDYMLRHSALSNKNVETEVDRYIAWPGQAVAYKIGELRIRSLRTRAEKLLGEAFNLRAFHDIVLEAGAITLPLLEERVMAWVETQTEGQ